MSFHPALRYAKHILKPSISYAQKNEDVVVSKLIKKVIRFIDIGANNGITGSNTFLFALDGAEGICFEPVKEIFEYLKKLYLFNFKVICINEGISDGYNKFDIRIDGALSTILETEDPVNRACLEEYINKNAETKIVSVKPLNYFLDLFPTFYEVDLISIDVEGHELNVIKSIDFNKTRIKSIIIESLGGKTTNYNIIEEILTSKNLIPVLTNHLNTIFLHKDLIDWSIINNIPSVYNEFEIIKAF
jgi:FkbM family methyltransferase